MDTCLPTRSTPNPGALLMDSQDRADDTPDQALGHGRAAQQAVLAEVLAEVVAERGRQNKQWGGAEHDDEHGPDEFLGFIRRQVSKDGDVRERLIKIAALAVAAIESLDRNTRDYGTHDE